MILSQYGSSSIIDYQNHLISKYHRLYRNMKSEYQKHVHAKNSEEEHMGRYKNAQNIFELVIYQKKFLKKTNYYIQ